MKKLLLLGIIVSPALIKAATDEEDFLIRHQINEAKRAMEKKMRVENPWNPAGRVSYENYMRQFRELMMAREPEILEKAGIDKATADRYGGVFGGGSYRSNPMVMSR